MAPVKIQEETVGPPSAHAIRVLVTGFGPFWRYTENPSWLAVKPLHNTILRVEPSTDPVFVQNPQTIPTHGPQGPPVTVQPIPLDDADHMPIDDDKALPPSSLEIHITTLQVPVTYSAVLSSVPGIYARPPMLPESLDPLPMPEPPHNGYDFIFHVGVAGRGHLRLEQVAHKIGYRMKDADGQYAPVVQLHKESAQDAAAAAAAEAERAGVRQLDIVPVTDIGPPLAPTILPPGVNGDVAERPRHAEVVEHPAVRGYAVGYEQFADELPTEIDVASLIHSMKESGITVYSSMDAGHYLCDFLFYGSLAEAKRVARGQEKDKIRNTPPRATPVLFMHCPPDGQPLKTEAVTSAIKFIVAWICRSTRP